MYRQPAAPEDDVILFTCTTGVSPAILGLLLVGPVLLVGLGVLTDAAGTMLLAGLPFVFALFVLWIARRTTVITHKTLRSRRFFATRTFPLHAVVRLAVPHASAAALAATSDSRLTAGLLVWDATGSLFAIPSQVPTEILRGVVAQALPAALQRAEEAIAAGGRYADADGLSALDPTSLHGRTVGLLASVPRTAKLETVVRVDANGRVELSQGASFMIAAQDLVLCELLRRRGVTLDVPMALVGLL